MYKGMQGLSCGVKCCIFYTNRRLYTRRIARALFCGVWTCDVKGMVSQDEK